jgi:hypothetical protein
MPLKAPRSTSSGVSFRAMPHASFPTRLKGEPSGDGAEIKQPRSRTSCAGGPKPELLRQTGDCIRPTGQTLPLKLGESNVQFEPGQNALSTLLIEQAQRGA